MLARLLSNSWPRDLLASASRSAEITGVSHHAWPANFCEWISLDSCMAVWLLLQLFVFLVRAWHIGFLIMDSALLFIQSMMKVHFHGIEIKSRCFLFEVQKPFPYLSTETFSGGWQLGIAGGGDNRITSLKWWSSILDETRYSCLKRWTKARFLSGPALKVRDLCSSV